ncbi:hypothetical protein EJ04DRAFT_578035 [Polyplosphaeria fusca]|uniref:Uncharacterized protein n=1 Tax=Polyplosphaeria fusca TaxID=682080 RepID=A0A9P4QS73_9PLEO|nr:hypothetical protein EJ04DRAFT_578035 [Polyplosphaeria fusca]
MSSIISSLSDLVQSVFEVIWSFITTAGHLVQRTLGFGLHICEVAVNVVIEFFKGLVDLAGGIVEFVVGNLLILGVLAAAFVGFLQYQKKQGNTVKIGDKKLN